jgi:1-acyl-sn-glycerol-3-phosphate acyltransferase
MLSENKTLSYLRNVLVSSMDWILMGGATGFLFAITVVVFWPLSVLFEKSSGQLPHRIAQLWGRVIMGILPFREVRTEGLERIRRGKPYIVVSNHQSMLDILVLLSKLPRPPNSRRWSRR